MFLSAGQPREVTLEVPFGALKRWNEEMNDVIEPGIFTIMIGPSVNDVYFTKRVRYN